MEELKSVNNNPKTRNPVIPEIVRRIAKLRTSLGYSRKELANGISVSQDQIADIENGEQNAKLERLEQIASFCNVPTDYLLIDYHDDFIIYAIDGYLHRMKPEIIVKSISLLNILVSPAKEYDNSSRELDFCSFEESDILYKDSPKPIKFKDKLKLYRKELGLGQAGFSKEIGIA